MRLCVLTIILCSCLNIVVSNAAPCDKPYAIIESINLTGNETTKDHVIIGELTFAVGDTILTHELEALLEDNRKRVNNLRLFHFVNQSYTCINGNVEVNFQVQERFYLYPVPILDFADRNFNAWLEKKDWGRIDYGISLARRNFRGRNEDVRLRIQQGFNKRLELSYRVPYIIRKYNLGAEVGLSDYKSRTTSYTNFKNKQRFIEQSDAFPLRRTSVAVGIIHRQSVQRQQGLRFSYHDERISDTVSYLNPEYYRNDLHERSYFRLELYKVINTRNNFVYPLTGSYFEAGVAQTFFLQNSGTPFITARAKYAHYSEVSEKYSYMVGAEGQLRLAGEYAFADNVALGYRSYVRGYELYIIGGQHYGLFKQGLSRELLTEKRLRIKFIDNPKFNNIPLSVYLNAFTDAGYVVDNTFQKGNPLTNRLLAGGGLGLHLITFYDVVFRTEYTLNREGDRGLYFSTRIPF